MIDPNDFIQIEMDEDEDKKKPKKERIYEQKLRKIKRNSGQEYTTKKSKVVAAKKFENKDCFCTKKCFNRIDCDERKSIFEKFWNLKNFKAQNLYLCNTVHQRSIKQRRPRTSERPMRKASYEYFLTKKDETEVAVCRKFFLETFQVSVGRLSRALNAETPGSDLRGKMPGSSRKTDEAKIKAVREHILTVLAYESECSGPAELKNPKPDLNISKMYRLYAEECQKNNESFVKECIYRKVFNTEFNLNFASRKETD